MSYTITNDGTHGRYISQVVRDGVTANFTARPWFQLRTWVGWHRWMLLCTLALLWLAHLGREAHQITAVSCDASDQEPGEPGAMVVFGVAALGLPAHITWSTAEMRRLFFIALALPLLSTLFRLSWVAFRVLHNFKARRSHYRRRLVLIHQGFP